MKLPAYISSHFNRLTELVKKYYDELLVSAAVFGSLAREAFERNKSDLDLLLILTKVSDSYCERVDEFVENVLMPYYNSPEYINTLRKAYIPPVSVVIYSRNEAKFFHDIYLDMTLWCEILYDRDFFLRRVLDAMRKRIDEWGSIRKEVSGKPFWILKPDLRIGEELKEKAKPLL